MEGTIARPSPGSAHQLTESEWQRLEGDPDFQALYKQKMAFIIPATIFFIVYYFSLPVLVGYYPTMMETKVIGDINVAYLFALSQFVMTWVVTGLYVGQAKKWDVQAAAIIAKVKGGRA